jgi:hypothetical protein
MAIRFSMSADHNLDSWDDPQKHLFITECRMPESNMGKSVKKTDKKTKVLGDGLLPWNGCDR